MVVHAAGTFLRQARRAAHLSQRDLAELAGVHQPAVAALEADERDTRVGQLDRYLAAAGQRLIAVPAGAATASETADRLYAAVRDEAPSRRLDGLALRILIGFSDRLREADPTTKVVLCVTPPAPCGDRRFDATLAGIVEYHLAGSKLPIPAWASAEDRVLEEPWSPSRYLDEAVDEIPAPFRRRNVLLAASELASV